MRVVKPECDWGGDTPRVLANDNTATSIVVIGNVQIRVITMVHTRIVTIGLKYLNNPEKRLLKQ